MLKISEFTCLSVMLHFSGINPTMRTTAKEAEARLIINENVPRPAIATGYKKSYMDTVSTSHITIDKTRFIYEVLDKYGNSSNSKNWTILLTGPHKWGKTTHLLMLYDYLQQYVHTHETTNSSEEDYYYGDWSTGEDGESRYRKYHGVLKSDIGSNGRFFLNGTLNNHQTLKSKFLISEYQNFTETYLGKSPVIYLSFRDITGLNYETYKNSLGTLISKALEPYQYFKEAYKTWVRDERLDYSISWGGPEGKYNNLEKPCRIISEYHGRDVAIILIDDYDEPINRALLHPQFKESDRYKSVQYYNDILQKALWENDYLKFAIMTGTYRWSGHHRSLSAFKNIIEYNYPRSRFSRSFGINEREFDLLCEYLSIPRQRRTQLKNWFNGYRTGKNLDTKIFNPYSLAKYLHSGKFKDNEEGENNNIIDLLLPYFLRDQKFLDNFVRLLSGHTITVDIGNLTFTPEPTSSFEGNPSNSVSLPQIPYIKSAFKFMLAAGYLTPHHDITPLNVNGTLTLRIPNAEIRCRLRKLFQRQLQTFEKSLEKRLQNLMLDFIAFAMNNQSRSIKLEKAMYRFLDGSPHFVNVTPNHADKNVSLAKLRRNRNLVHSMPNWIAAISTEFQFQPIECVLEVNNIIHSPRHVFVHKNSAIICDFVYDNDATVFATVLNQTRADEWPEISFHFPNTTESVSRAKLILVHVSQNKTTKIRGKDVELKI